jgi:hypothetical protein
MCTACVDLPPTARHVAFWMVRQAFRGAVGVLLAALLAGCLGGQTGQPSSLQCGSQLSSSSEWSGTTVGVAAAAFTGTYQAPLQWQQESRFASTHTPVDVQDSVELTIAYENASANPDCGGGLRVPVVVTLTTSASGIAESGDAVLAIPPSRGALTGSLSYGSQRLGLDATLSEVSAGVSLTGGFESRVEGSPGASASFAVEP